MKKLLLLLVLSISSITKAQWINKKVDNAFDDPYKICYNLSNEDKSVALKLENVDGDVVMYILSSYFCDVDITCDLSFYVNGAYDKYYIEDLTISEDQTALFILNNLTASNGFVPFKKCTHVKIRINEGYCGSKTYTFPMKGSTNSYNFVLNQ